MYDFAPIKVNLIPIELKLGQIGNTITVLASPFLTNKFFTSSIVVPINEMTNTSAMYIARPYTQEGENLPVIYRMPDNPCKLFECGIQEGADIVVITDTEKRTSMRQALAFIGKMFDIPQSEVDAIPVPVDDCKPNESKFGPSLTSSNL